ncbi:uncharacterized protein V1516DRAFT_682568, partial [Lipomyces oligophaga]|uniref:uncharacterized protein n=1 Tax=Lipomyces oligophaga TaxID=45792 RepID=UPI0034CE7117
MSAALAFTYVSYDSHDSLSFLLAWMSLVPQTICIVYLTQALSRREVETLMLGAGQVASEIANLILKRIFLNERPKHGNLSGGVDSFGYGMPSAHAQYMAFYSTYIILWMFLRAHHFSKIKRFSRSIGLVLLSVSVCVSRVYLEYHTTWQVTVGVIVGIILGTAWFSVISTLRELGVVEYFLQFSIFKMFCIKDTSLISNFVVDEHRIWSKQQQIYMPLRFIEPSQKS